MAILALTAMLAPLVAGVQVIVTTARAQETARAVARQVARGDDPERAAARGVQALPGATAIVRREGGDAVVTVAVELRLPFRLSAEVARTARTSLELP
ncbi:MAG: TadE family type IV pilus minor pilin [Candidatus Nanopelagicales bacterium]